MPRKPAPALVANVQRRWHRNHGAYYFARVLNSRGDMLACDVTEYATPEQALCAARALVAAYGKPAVAVEPAKPHDVIAWASSFLREHCPRVFTGKLVRNARGLWVNQTAKRPSLDACEALAALSAQFA